MNCITHKEYKKFVSEKVGKLPSQKHLAVCTVCAFRTTKVNSLVYSLSLYKKKEKLT